MLITQVRVDSGPIVAKGETVPTVGHGAIVTIILVDPIWRGMTKMRWDWLLQFGMFVAALSQMGTVVSAQDLRPTQNHLF